MVDARPEPLAIEPATTAVIVVDMQNDFGAEGGMFSRAGIPIADIVILGKPKQQMKLTESVRADEISAGQTSVRVDDPGGAVGDPPGWRPRARGRRGRSGARV